MTQQTYKQIDPKQHVFFAPNGQVDVAELARPLLPPASSISRRGYPFYSVDVTPEQHGVPGMPVITVRFQLVWDEKENKQKGWEFHGVKLRLSARGEPVVARVMAPSQKSLRRGEGLVNRPADEAPGSTATRTKKTPAAPTGAKAPRSKKTAKPEKAAEQLNEDLE